MPGRIEESLSRFTPSPGGLDRDAILFAAGRASARPDRKWPTLAALLALSQVLTIALLWAPTPPPTITPAVPVVPSDPVPTFPVVRDWRPTFDENPVPPPSSDDLMPDEPPLHASSVWVRIAE